jgi:hypothetical protein
LSSALSYPFHMLARVVCGGQGTQTQRLRLHYDALTAGKYAQRAPGRRAPASGSVLGCVAHAHRKQLNEKLVLPNSVKDIFRCPRDEINPAKLELLCAAVRSEIEGEVLVYLRTENDIESLAGAVENSISKVFADEVGKGCAVIPEGSRIWVEVPDGLDLLAKRSAVAGLVRTLQEGEAVRVKLRPLGTNRAPPLDTFARELMRELPFSALAKGKPIEEMRDRLLLCLWDALFLTACERWTTVEVSNLTPSAALELGYWFNRGQENSKKPLFDSLCAMCGCLLYAGANYMGNTCYGPGGRTGNGGRHASPSLFVCPPPPSKDLP